MFDPFLQGVVERRKKYDAYLKQRRQSCSGLSTPRNRTPTKSSALKRDHTPSNKKEDKNQSANSELEVSI